MNINFVETFLRMEKENDLCNKKFDVFSYWIYIRHNVYVLIYEQREQLTYFSKPTKGTAFKNIIKSLIYYKVGKIKKAEILFLNSNRKMLVDGTYISKEMEELISHYNDKALVLEGLYYGKRYSPTNEYNVFYTDWLDLLCMNYMHFHYYLGDILCINKELSKLAKEIASIVQRYFEIDFEVELRKMLIKSYYEYMFWYRTVKLLLNKVSPKIIIEEDAYCSVRNMVFNEISREENIVTIELQHGLPDELTYRYSDENIKQLPNKIFLFSIFMKELANPSLRDEDIVITGYPFLESMKKKKALKKAYKENNRKVILFISGQAYQLELCRFAIGLERFFKDKSEYLIRFKLHPDEQCSQELYESGFDIVSDSSKNIYDFFGDTYVQIGVNSTGLIEGLAFGLKTYCVDLTEINEMYKLVEKKLVIIVHDPVEVYNDLNKSQGNNAMDETVRNYLWPENALNNMIDVIDKI